MKLNFLGRGSAFNTSEGNTSAYFIENKTLFLIDCGETVFTKLLQENLLNEKNDLIIFITHTHFDHVGSISSLVLYQYHAFNKITKICVANEQQEELVSTLLTIGGVNNSYYKFIDQTELDEEYFSFDTVRFEPTPHTKTLHSSNLVFQTEQGIVFYSGDTSSLDNLTQIIDNKQEIDQIYVEVCNNDSPTSSHIKVNMLEKAIPEELKEKVWCMHINNNQCLTELKQAGFKAVSVLDKYKILSELQRKIMVK